MWFDGEPMEKIFIRLNMYFDRGNLQIMAPAIVVDSLVTTVSRFEYSQSKYTFKRPFFSYHRFSIDPRKSYKATNLAFNRQILRVVPYFSECIRVCKSAWLLFQMAFFIKSGSRMGFWVICSAAIVRQTKEQNKMAK